MRLLKLEKIAVSRFIWNSFFFFLAVFLADRSLQGSYSVSIKIAHTEEEEKNRNSGQGMIKLRSEPRGPSLHSSAQSRSI
jgi:hypothetical protein